MRYNDRKSIYIVVSYNDTFIGKIIRKRAEMKFWNRYAGDKYTHVSLSLELQLNNMMSFARKKVNNPLIAGLIKEDIGLGVFARSGEQSRIAVMEIPVSVEQYNLIQSLMGEYWNRRDMLKYNILGLFSMLLYGKGIKIKDKYICSQWVAEILEDSGVYHFERKRPCDVRPFDYYDTFKKNIIYEGLTVEYSKLRNEKSCDRGRIYAGTKDTPDFL